MSSNNRKAACLTLAILAQMCLLASGFIAPIVATARTHNSNSINNNYRKFDDALSRQSLAMSSAPSSDDSSSEEDIMEQDSASATADNSRNEIYIKSLIENFSFALDRWVITGSPVKVRT